MKLSLVKRGFKFRVWDTISNWLDRLKGWLSEQRGLSLEVTCPACKKDGEVSELLEFGQIYEFTCPSCQSKFVVVVPEIKIIPGQIESVTHG